MRWRDECDAIAALLGLYAFSRGEREAPPYGDYSVTAIEALKAGGLVIEPEPHGIKLTKDGVVTAALIKASLVAMLAANETELAGVERAVRRDADALRREQAQ